MRLIPYLLLIHTSFTYFCVQIPVSALPVLNPTTYISNSPCLDDYEIPLYINMSNRMAQLNIRLPYSIFDNGPSIGPQGPQGETGPKGSTGAMGPQGVSGKDGRDGRDGKDGTDGKDYPATQVQYWILNWMNFGLVVILLIWNVMLTITLKKYNKNDQIHGQNEQKKSNKRRKEKSRETIMSEDKSSIQINVEYPTQN